MSLPLIADTAAEVHRLAIAGSALAAGDFRLKKILPQLEALGAKAPIFSRIAQGVKAVIDEPDAAKAGRALLDLSTLLTAIQYTQSPHGAEGEFTAVNTTVQSWTPTVAGYRTLAAVVQALTSSGEGRLEVVRDACERGLFKDLRLLQPAVGALSDRFGELADFVCDHAIPQLGPSVIPLLKAGFDPKGGNTHVRQLRALCAVDSEEGRALARTALEEARKEMKVAALNALRGSDKDEAIIISLTKDRSDDVRHAAIRALGGMHGGGARATLVNMFSGKDAAVAIASAAALGGEMAPELFELGCSLLSAAEAGPDPASAVRETAALAGARAGRTDAPTKAFLERCLAHRVIMADADASATIVGTAYSLNLPDWDAMLVENRDHFSDRALMFAFLAGHRSLSPGALLSAFGRIYQKASLKDALCYLLAGIPPSGINPVPVASLDRGWLQEALRKQHPRAVAFLAVEGDRAALEFLLRTDEEQNKKFTHYVHRFADAIVRISPDGAPEYLISRIEGKHAAQPDYIQYAEDLFRRLESLDARVLPGILARGCSLSGVWKERFDLAISSLQHKGAQALQL